VEEEGDREGEDEEMESNSNYEGSNSQDGSGHNSNDDDSAGATSAESGSASGSSKPSESSSSNKRSIETIFGLSTTTSETFDRSESPGSGSGDDCPNYEDLEHKMTHGGETSNSVDDGFVSNYGPSKQGRHKSKGETEIPIPIVEAFTNHDAQSGMYGPSKQAHDAKSKRKHSIFESSPMIYPSDSEPI
jgi:hypothetical protein